MYSKLGNRYAGNVISSVITFYSTLLSVLLLSVLSIIWTFLFQSSDYILPPSLIASVFCCLFSHWKLEHQGWRASHVAAFNILKLVARKMVPTIPAVLWPLDGTSKAETIFCVTDSYCWNYLPTGYAFEDVKFYCIMYILLPKDMNFMVKCKKLQLGCLG